MLEESSRSLLIAHNLELHVAKYLAVSVSIVYHSEYVYLNFSSKTQVTILQRSILYIKF